MSVRFDPQTGLYADDVATVREEVRQNWIDAFHTNPDLPELRTDPETPAGQLIDSQTNAIVQKDNEVLFLGQQFNPLVAEGVWQDALAKIYFLSRKVEQQSVCICVCTGLFGTVIPEGAVIKSTVDEREWICTANVTIPVDGHALVGFACEEGGPIEAQAHTLTQIVTVVPGWDTVDNEVAAIVGRLTETQAEFEQRRFNSVAKNARGSLASIYGSLADLEGVIDCMVLENTIDTPVIIKGVEIPGHSIYASVVGGDDEAIAEMLYRKKDAGCGTAGNVQVSYQDNDIPGKPVYTYNIERPAPLDFGIRVTITVTPETPADIEERIKDALIADFNGLDPQHGNLRIGIGQDVFASRFYCPVLSAGVQNLISVEIAAPVTAGVWGSAVTINADQTPVLDRNNIIVVTV